MKLWISQTAHNHTFYYSYETFYFSKFSEKRGIVEYL